MGILESVKKAREVDTGSFGVIHTSKMRKITIHLLAKNEVNRSNG